MPKVNGINIVEVWGYDELLPILFDAYRVLYISYQALYKVKLKNPYTKPLDKKRWFLEDEITDNLVVDEHTFDKLFEYDLIPQSKNIQKKTKIDVAIRYGTQIGRNKYLEIECKLLHKTNLNYYIDGGIEKFKNNKYSEELPVGGMLAYNTQSTIPENMILLNNKIIKKISKEEQLQTFKIPNINTETYKSNHKRQENGNIDIYTMAFDFKGVINN